jgi:phosphoglycerol transferase MdoB-like AlkP superfamily enzyme
MMMTHDHPTLQMFGTPLFTILVGTVFLAAVAGMVFGVWRWRQRTGKIVFVASALILLLFALAVVLVLITVASGSMG